jgi:hypothetical protein
MPDYADIYRATFEQLGTPLLPDSGIPETDLASAGQKLGFQLPAALRSYYLVAGKHKLNRVYNRLYDPNAWRVHLDHLVFMEENQAVVFWGIPMKQLSLLDPSIYQAPKYKGQPHAWYLEHDNCSTWLQVMLHWQATFGGGHPFTQTAPAPPDTLPTLDQQWTFIGEVNGMRAYNRPGQAVCYLQWQDFFETTPSWRIFAGSSTSDGINSIAKDLSLKWS